MTVLDSSDVIRARTSAPFRISRRRWRRLLAELQRRGDGVRESGAFLLARRDSDRVVEIAYYDDLDADCLTGGITFASSGFTSLWRICREHGLRVVADVHTHPGTWVKQSHIDAANPMVSRLGHVAIIVPSYGEARRVGECGVHIYLGSRLWVSVPIEQAGGVVTVYGMLSRESAADLWSAVRRTLARATRP